MDNIQQQIEHAAQLISDADSILLTAGAGFGVDSGLPDLRGDQGFWKAYPPYQRLGVSFVDMASPDHFEKDPSFAWGFYGHRRNLYRQTTPHEGFHILQRLVQNKSHFVFTSNVDNHFSKAGFNPNNVMECHGSIEHDQCTQFCPMHVHDSDDTNFDINEDTMRATSELPRCPHCGSLSRPNILMFGDYKWNPERTEEQADRYNDWAQQQNPNKTVVIECGAGTHIPTVRVEGERWNARGARLIRINPREADTLFENQIAIPLGALDALSRIEQSIRANAAA